MPYNHYNVKVIFETAIETQGDEFDAKLIALEQLRTAIEEMQRDMEKGTDPEIEDFFDIEVKPLED
jgi:hypothetical protein